MLFLNCHSDKGCPHLKWQHLPSPDLQSLGCGSGAISTFLVGCVVGFLVISPGCPLRFSGGMVDETASLPTEYKAYYHLFPITDHVVSH